MSAPRQPKEIASKLSESKVQKQKKPAGSTLSHEIGSAALAAGVEIGCFHPFDTATKRLMNHKKAIYDANKPFHVNAKEACNVAFRDPKTNTVSVYPGLLPATAYKILQRGFKFGGQPIVEESLRKHVFDPSTLFWPTALSGAIMGAGEVVFLPLDIYKIRLQTGSKDAGFSYRGVGVTIFRNTVGSFTLFGVPVLIQSMLVNNKQPTRIEKIGTQFAGAAACLIVSNPPDVIKTRMQADAKSGGAFKIGMGIARKNPLQFFKSIGPKIGTQGVKLTLFMAAKDKITEMFNEQESDHSEPKFRSPAGK